MQNVETFPSHQVLSSVLSPVICLFLLTGCAIKKMAVNSMADALSESRNSVFASDNDPEFVGEALPFALKTMESLLQATPRHKKLLIGTASGFVQYAHAYVLRPAQALESVDLAASRHGLERAKRFFLRARGYGLRALELDYPGISEQLEADPVTAAARLQKKDVPALYWTGVAWGSAVSVAKDDMALVGDLPVVTAMLERALVLDESWNRGAIHEFFIVFDAGRSEAEGGGLESAEAHFERAVELNGGCSISPLVSLAESVCVRKQDRTRFKKLLFDALEFDVDSHPENRLANMFAQSKAERLLQRIDDLFFLGDEEEVEQNQSPNDKP